MNLRDQVIYMNRPAWIVGKRQPRMEEHGRFYNLSRKPNTAKVDYYDVPEHYIKSIFIPTSGAAQILEFANGNN